MVVEISQLDITHTADGKNPLLKSFFPTPFPNETVGKRSPEIYLISKILSIPRIY
jgi:hypothetical protein